MVLTSKLPEKVTQCVFKFEFVEDKRFAGQGGSEFA